MSILFYAADSNVFPPVAPWTETFTGDNGSAPNSLYWEQPTSVFGITSYPEDMTIQDNKCQFTGPVNGSSVRESWLKTKFNMVGDFDVQLDFDITTFDVAGGSGQAQYAALIYIVNATNDSVVGWIARNRTTLMVNGYGSDGNVLPAAYFAGADLTGGLRATRVGNGFYVYWWNGQWQWNGFTSGRAVGSLAGNEIYFYIRFSNAINNDVVSSVDNFTINSGTIVTP
jgi:hypothetical protein